MPSYKGKFRPNNPHKYKGDPTSVIYRSRWELNLMAYFDSHPNVKWWQSEEVIIPYKSPIDGKYHRYFPDFLVRMINKDGIEETVLIEVKPYSQTMPPDISKKNATKTGRVSRRYLNEVKTYGINDAKWTAAEEFCKDKGWKFIIMTEKEIFGNKQW
jgi:hypothetical protein